MITADIPHNEKERLEALKKLNLLDTPIEDRFEKIVRLACSSLQVPIASFVLIDDSRQWIKATQGLKEYETSRDVAFCAHTILEDDMMIVKDARLDQRFSDNPFVTQDPNITFYAGCPVKDPTGHKIGTLCVVDNKPRDINEDEKQNLRDLASLIENELKVTQLNQEKTKFISALDTANRRTMVDPVTRLWNRTGLNALATREWTQAKRRKQQIIAAVVDVDDFKKINQTHGQEAGNLVLQHVARKLLTATRTDDVVGRSGADEFLIILTDCIESSALDTADRIRKTVELTPVALPSGPLNITVSIGVSSIMPEKNDTIAGLVKLAELALFEAKKKGGHRVVGANPSLGLAPVSDGDPFTYDITLDI